MFMDKTINFIKLRAPLSLCNDYNMKLVKLREDTNQSALGKIA